MHLAPRAPQRVPGWGEARPRETTRANVWFTCLSAEKPLRTKKEEASTPPEREGTLGVPKMMTLPWGPHVRITQVQWGPCWSPKPGWENRHLLQVLTQVQELMVMTEVLVLLLVSSLAVASYDPSASSQNSQQSQASGLTGLDTSGLALGVDPS